MIATEWRSFYQFGEIYTTVKVQVQQTNLENRVQSYDLRIVMNLYLWRC